MSLMTSASSTDPAGLSDSELARRRVARYALNDLDLEWQLLLMLGLDESWSTAFRNDARAKR